MHTQLFLHKKLCSYQSGRITARYFSAYIIIPKLYIKLSSQKWMFFINNIYKYFQCSYCVRLYWASQPNGYQIYAVAVYSKLFALYCRLHMYKYLTVCGTNAQCYAPLAVTAKRNILPLYRGGGIPDHCRAAHIVYY